MAEEEDYSDGDLSGPEEEDGSEDSRAEGDEEEESEEEEEAEEGEEEAEELSEREEEEEEAPKKEKKEKKEAKGKKPATKEKKEERPKPWESRRPADLVVDVSGAVKPASYPTLSRLEYTSAMGKRAELLGQGKSQPTIEPEPGESPLHLAKREYEEGKSPMMIRRNLPGGTTETWRIHDLKFYDA